MGVLYWMFPSYSFFKYLMHWNYMGPVIPAFPFFSTRGRPAGRTKTDATKTEVKRAICCLLRQSPSVKRKRLKSPSPSPSPSPWIEGRLEPLFKGKQEEEEEAAKLEASLKFVAMVEWSRPETQAEDRTKL
ncbi:hypothetical protein NC651_023802 [Populus alba x Populus x berolinensis]|nr:hypothetical protein NC651_023802 [Populus alba x Populus x berolinensis]